MLKGCSRIHGSEFREQISVAHRLIGDHLMARLSHVQVVAGGDPLFAGYHEHEDTFDSRSYRDTAHCLYPIHLQGPADRKVSTVVLPVLEPKWCGVYTIVHEYAHSLDWALGRDWTCEPVNDYARNNRDEAFACAFTAWVWGRGPDRDKLHDRDREFFRAL